MTTTVFVCDTCRFSREDKISPDGQTGGEMLADRIEALAAPVAELTVVRQSCLMGCERHCNTAVSAPGKLTYVLGRFDPEPEAAEAIVEYAQGHAISDTGAVPFRQWPQGVKGHFVARIPPLTK